RQRAARGAVGHAHRADRAAGADRPAHGAVLQGSARAAGAAPREAGAQGGRAQACTQGRRRVDSPTPRPRPASEPRRAPDAPHGADSRAIRTASRSPASPVPNRSLSGGIWCVAALLLVLALPARAYDPALRWYTLRTPHLVVHYHDGLAPLAQRAARDLELAHALLVPAMGHAPRRKVQVVISDDTDSANGSATAYLRPTIRLF